MPNTLTKARPDESKFYYNFIKCGFNYGSAGGTQVYIPLAAGESLREVSSSSGGTENLVMIAPFDGSIETVWARSEEVCGSTVIRMYYSSSAIEIPAPTSYSVTVDMSVDDTSYEFDFTGATNTFSQGNILMFSFDPTNDANDVHFMIVLKYNVTT